MRSRKRPHKSSGRMASKGFPNPIDVHVGTRIRLRRKFLGMNQQGLARALGLTFQQVQKYESGANRVSSSRLFDLAKVLEVTVSFFFEQMSRDVELQTPSSLLEKNSLPQIQVKDPLLARRDAVELIRAYYAIDDVGTRKKVFELIKAVARSRGEAERAGEPGK